MSSTQIAQRTVRLSHMEHPSDVQTVMTITVEADDSVFNVQDAAAVRMALITQGVNVADGTVRSVRHGQYRITGRQRPSWYIARMREALEAKGFVIDIND